MTQLAWHINRFFPLELKGCGTKVVSLAMLSHTAQKLSGMRHSVLCSQMRGQEFGQVEMSGLSPALEEVWGHRWEDWSLWVTCIVGAKIIWVDMFSHTCGNWTGTSSAALSLGRQCLAFHMAWAAHSVTLRTRDEWCFQDNQLGVHGLSWAITEIRGSLLCFLLMSSKSAQVPGEGPPQSTGIDDSTQSNSQ